MTEKILVVYATRYGSTAGVACTIADELRLNGYEVDVRTMDEVRDLRGYSAVFVGSPIRVGRWLKKARLFLEEHQADFKLLPVALFTVCITIIDDTPENREIARGFLTKLYEFVNPLASGIFPGAVDVKKLNLLEKFMLHFMELEPGDYRHSDEVREWVRANLPRLQAVIRHYAA